MRITAFNYSDPDQVITLGLSTGKIIQFKKKGFDSKHLLTSKEYEVIKFFDVGNGHKGEIRCLCYENIKGTSYLITGSVDRTIKVWENDPKAKNVVQTMVGHNGTILALKYAKLSDTIFSASNDKTLKIWKQEDGREFLYHPWYVVFQVIYDFSMKKMINYQAYLTTFLLKESETLTVFTGDTEGSLHILKQEENWKPTSNFIIEKSYFNFHRLHVIQILSIDKDNTMFSIGFDQKIIGFEELAGKQFFSYKNPHKCLFTSIDWNPSYQELLASDEQGRIYFINIQTDKQVQEYKLYDCKINELHLIGKQNNNTSILDKSQQLIIVTDNFIDVLRMKRGIKAGNLLDAHKGPIVGLISIEFPQLKKQKEPSKLISASLDNTIRIWDPKDMSCINVLENSEKNEISCIHYLKNANLLVTGHDNGEVKLWNIDLGSCLVVDQSHSPLRHINMVCCLSSKVFQMSNSLQGDFSEFLFSAGYDGKINIWEIFEKKQFGHSSSLMASNIVPQLKHSIIANKNVEADSIGNEILCMIFDDNTNCIVAAGNKAEIYFVEMFSYEHRMIFKGHKDSINCLAIDGRILFSGSDDKSIRLWDTVSIQCLTYFEAHDEGVKDMLIIQESGHLVSCSLGNIFVWDYPMQKIVQKFAKQEHLKTLSYINEEKSLFVGTDENNIYNYLMGELIEVSIVDKGQLQLGESSVKLKGNKTVFVIDDNGIEESKEDLPSPTKSLKKKQFNDFGVKLENLNSNEYLKQLEEKNKQMLQELQK